jgi:hypothetical protein
MKTTAVKLRVAQAIMPAGTSLGGTGFSRSVVARIRTHAQAKACATQVVVLLVCGGAPAQIFDYDKSVALNFTQKELDHRDGVRLSSCSFESQGGKAIGFLIEPEAAGPQHGYVNTDPDMDATFIAWGYRIKPSARTDRIRNFDLAPK